MNTIVYAGRLKDKKELIHSSSGGAYIALSDFFLKNNNAVVCATYNYNLAETVFELILTVRDRNKARGSKYMQSKPGDIFEQAYQWLMDNPNKKLLFIGMGCQADGFRKYVELKNIKEQVYIVDIICHGSPSPKLWREYVDSLQKREHGNIEFVTFKDKRNGWKSPVAFARINGQEILIEDYVKVFYSKCALRPSCHRCPYTTTERKTDITIGDFWHIEETIPDFYDINGNSVFLLHTDKGIQLFESIKEIINYRESNIEQCWQKNLEEPTPASKYRTKFWRDYKRRGIDFIMRKYGSDSLKTKIKEKFRKVIGGGVYFK